MRTLIYTSRGMSITITEDPYSAFFMDFNNFKPNLKSGIFETGRGYRQDGINTYSASLSNLTPRIEFTFNAGVYGDRDNHVARVADEYRTWLADILNPKYEGVLTYTSYSKSAILTARPTAVPAMDNFDITNGTIDFTVDFYSDSAVWESQESFMAQAGYVEGGLTLPFTFPFTFGNFVASTYVYNPCIHDIYPILTFHYNNNQVAIENRTNGDILRLNKSILPGQKLVVDTAPFKMSGNLYEQDGENWRFTENAIYWITNDSTDNFRLQPGTNWIVVNSAGAGAVPACEIEWRIPYEAV